MKLSKKELEEKIKRLDKALETIVIDHVTLALTCLAALDSCTIEADAKKITLVDNAYTLCNHVKDKWTKESPSPKKD